MRVAIALGGIAALTLAVIVVVNGLEPDTRPIETEPLGTLVLPGDVYDPVAAGEPLPDGYRDALGRDDILPIYDPSFVTAAQAGWSDGVLVIGLAVHGEAKAYPVSWLDRREMVIDSIAGIPVLVTW